MKSNGPALIVSRISSKWQSCRIITPNIEKTYLTLFKNKVKIFNYHSEMTMWEVLDLAKEIKSYNPAKIIFIDHTPHPTNLIEAIDVIYETKKLPPIYFHVYGDFTAKAKDWLFSEKTLSKARCHFICSSYRQKKLIEVFLKQKKDATHIGIFPYDSNNYHFDENIRNTARAELKLSHQNKLVIYTGRLSAQKNTLALTREMAIHLSRNPQTYFYIAGEFDNISAPTFGAREPSGGFKKRWLSLLETFDINIKNRISYLGNLNPLELKKLYNAADAYISLSTHHDEDFGMAPLEALACGCPVILSNWGGYAGFDIDKKSCALVPIKIKSTGLFYEPTKVQNLLNKFLNHTKNTQERILRSYMYKDRFSIHASVPMYRNFLKKKSIRFKGFSKFMLEIKNADFVHNSDQPLFPKGPVSKSFYYDIYKNYIRL